MAMLSELRLTSEEKNRENDTGREADTGLDYCIANAKVGLFQKKQCNNQNVSFLCPSNHQ